MVRQETQLSPLTSRVTSAGRECVRLPDAPLAGDADDHSSGRFRAADLDPGDAPHPFCGRGRRAGG
jgi:hypothetical protein